MVLGKSAAEYMIVRQFLLYSECLIFNKEFLSIHPPWVLFPRKMLLLFVYVDARENMILLMFAVKDSLTFITLILSINNKKLV